MKLYSVMKLCNVMKLHSVMKLYRVKELYNVTELYNVIKLYRVMELYSVMKLYNFFFYFFKSTKCAKVDILTSGTENRGKGNSVKGKEEQKPVTTVALDRVCVRV